MKISLCVIFFFTLLIWGSFVHHSGAVMSPDSYTYERWADTLIARGFNIPAFLKSVEFPVPPYLYLGFISLVAFAKVCTGQFWQQTIVILNVVLGACLAVLISHLVYVFTKNKFAAWITALLYIINPEIILWSRYILSDTTYMFINFLIFYFIAGSFSPEQKRGLWHWAFIAATLLLNCFYRPTGLVMVPLTIFAVYLRTKKGEIPWIKIFAYLACCILISIVIHSVVIRNISLWPVGFGKSYLKDFVVTAYQKGVVIHDRPHTYHHAPVGFMDYMAITFDKLVHYFYFSDRLFSQGHKLLNLFAFVPLYALCVVGFIPVFKGGYPFPARSLIALCVMVIIVYSVYHAMTYIDFDWRYRLPVMPYLLFISGMGLDLLLKIKKERSHEKSSRYSLL